MLESHKNQGRSNILMNFKSALSQKTHGRKGMIGWDGADLLCAKALFRRNKEVG
ncbi:hypothetical protein U3A58_05860 [Algoriphagus sp. C2-6-M1]|uniref:hypothetical protein n=1 Tax=Algoriphagus persicinus TaxID=3108754 RepID=UPI002B3DC256|nr:hypothetical protein [Algoriphagus sp. C2-6-M1]MEB2779914.1 hypothetical protein [Algoriphagus sp. C2-6-M1]